MLGFPTMIALLAAALALVSAEEPNVKRLHWPASKDWRDSWNKEVETFGITPPTKEEWEGIGDFYTYDDKYMLSMRKEGKELQYRIHYHVDKHADEDLLEEMKVLSSHGYARVFGPRYDRALEYVSESARQRFMTWEQLDQCGQNRECLGAFAPEPELMDQNSTIVGVVHAVPAEMTIRCHNHENGLWCHNRVKEFNEGFFYVVDVRPDNEPDTIRRACVMCHDWPEDMLSKTDLNPPHCHSTPIDGVVVVVDRSLWDQVALPSAMHLFAPDGIPDPFLAPAGNATPSAEEWHQIAASYTYPTRYLLQVESTGSNEVKYHINFQSGSRVPEPQTAQEVAVLKKFGYARNFGNDYTGVLQYILETTGHYHGLFTDMQACSLDRKCEKAWRTEPALMDKNSTVTQILHAVPAELTVRCHSREDGVWCHNRVREFNQGMFYVVEVLPEGEDRPRIAGVMCHDWPEDLSHLTNLNPPHCHSTPADAYISIVAPNLWDSVKLPPAKNQYDYLPDTEKAALPSKHHHHHERSTDTEKVATNNDALNGRENYVRLTWPGAEDWRKTWDRV